MQKEFQESLAAAQENTAQLQAQVNTQKQLCSEQEGRVQSLMVRCEELKSEISHLKALVESACEVSVHVLPTAQLPWLS